jgi:hypothetical protein
MPTAAWFLGKVPSSRMSAVALRQAFFVGTGLGGELSEGGHRPSGSGTAEISPVPDPRSLIPDPFVRPLAASRKPHAGPYRLALTTNSPRMFLHPLSVVRLQ